MRIKITDIRQGQTLYAVHASVIEEVRGKIVAYVSVKTWRVAGKPNSDNIINSLAVPVLKDNWAGRSILDYNYWSDANNGLNRLFRSKGKAQRYAARVKALCLSTQEWRSITNNPFFSASYREEQDTYDAEVEDHYEALKHKELKTFQLPEGLTQYKVGDRVRFIDYYGDARHPKPKTYIIESIIENHDIETQYSVGHNQSLTLTGYDTKGISAKIVEKVVWSKKTKAAVEA